MEHDPVTTSRPDVLTRIAGVSFIAGAVIVIAANALHPRIGDPRDYHAMIQLIADTRGGYWELVHFFLALGMWALAAGFAGLYRTIRTDTGSALARLGFYGILMGTSLLTLDFGLEGMGRAVAVGVMQNAAGADQAAIEAFLVGISVVSYPLFGLMVVLYWVSIACIGAAIVGSDTYPQWSGWSLLGLGIATAVGAGLPYALFGASMTTDMVFAALAALSALVALYLGVRMVRTHGNPV